MRVFLMRPVPNNGVTGICVQNSCQGNDELMNVQPYWLKAYSTTCTVGPAHGVSYKMYAFVELVKLGTLKTVDGTSNARLFQSFQLLYPVLTALDAE